MPSKTEVVNGTTREASSASTAFPFLRRKPPNASTIDVLGGRSRSRSASNAAEPFAGEPLVAAASAAGSIRDAATSAASGAASGARAARRPTAPPRGCARSAGRPRLLPATGRTSRAGAARRRSCRTRTRGLRRRDRTGPATSIPEWRASRPPNRARFRRCHGSTRLVGRGRRQSASRRFGDERPLEAQPVERISRALRGARRRVDAARGIVAAPAGDDAKRSRSRGRRPPARRGSAGRR